MATVACGGSPRHHPNRIMVTSNGNVPAVVPNFHKHMLPTTIPPPPLHSYASAAYQPQCPNQIVHHQQYATFTSTQITSQTKIYCPPKPYSSTGQSIMYKQKQQLPPPLPLKKHQVHYHSLPVSISVQQQLPPQLPQKMRQRNISGGSVPMDSAIAARLIKRKTAVELLAESRPYYIKSEVMLDRKQHLIQLRSDNDNSGGSHIKDTVDRKLSPTTDSFKMPCKCFAPKLINQLFLGNWKLMLFR